MPKYAIFSNFLLPPTLRLKFRPQHTIVEFPEVIFSLHGQTKFYIYSDLCNASSVFLVLVRQFDYFMLFIPCIVINQIQYSSN
jgi:hypothetical protein